MIYAIGFLIWCGTNHIAKNLYVGREDGKA
jgi:hypothetical protein